MDDEYVIDRLRNRKALADVRINESKKNETSRRDYRNAIRIMDANINDIENATRFVKDNKKMLETYTVKKKKTAIQGIYSAIDSTNQVVSPSSRVKINITDKRMSLSDDEGRSSNICEPSSWRAMASMMIRQSVLSNTNFIQDMILDEPLAVLDDTSSADFSMYLPILAQDRLIILIEQKDSVFSNTDSISYRFEKIGKYTTVRRVK